jgi:hypothetical protein
VGRGLAGDAPASWYTPTAPGHEPRRRTRRVPPRHRGPRSRGRHPRRPEGPRRTTEAAVRETTTWTPWARRRSLASSSTDRGLGGLLDDGTGLGGAHSHPGRCHRARRRGARSRADPQTSGGGHARTVGEPGRVEGPARCRRRGPCPRHQHADGRYSHDRQSEDHRPPAPDGPPSPLPRAPAPVHVTILLGCLGTSPAGAGTTTGADPTGEPHRDGGDAPARRGVGPGIRRKGRQALVGGGEPAGAVATNR